MPYLVLALALFLVPRAAAAHGFGMRYDLPLPLDYFMWGGAAVVLLSFAATAIFSRAQDAEATYPTLTLCRFPSSVGLALRIFAVAVFALVVIAGYVGVPNPYRNISVVMVWVIGWVGVAFASALFGNVWAYLNPWSALFAWAERVKKISLDLPYPAWLGAWPGVISLFIFAWLEINWPGSGVPLNLAIALTIFSAITWTGMILFGRAAWARNGGVFVMVFALFSRFAIWEMRDGLLRLRPPAVGLLSERPATFSEIVFVVLILATVTYDGFTETEPFQTAALALFEILQGLGPNAVNVVSTIGLASFPLAFLFAYMLVIALVKAAGGGSAPFGQIAGRFVYSLIPIAIAYHLAHYLSLLVFEGQNVIALVSDPFGWGWNLFGTAGHRVDLTVMNAQFLWFFSVFAIVAGHVAAVYLAHREALRLFANRRAALISQIPMMILMVGYTTISLWIVAQPIVG